MVVESTSLLKEAESVMSKKTRFEEASIHCNRLSSMTTTTKRRIDKKGFMDMLEEV